MKEKYPEIASRAKVEVAEINWGDEPGVSNQEIYERGYSPKSTSPVIKYETKRERVNMISAITNKGSVRFMVFDETMTQQKLIGFMRHLIRDVGLKYS